MRILFVGSFVPERYDTKVKELSTAGNRFQWNYIKSLRNQNYEVSLISCLSIPISEEIKSELKADGCYYFKEDGLRQFRKKLKSEIKNYDLVYVYNSLYFWFGLSKWLNRAKIKHILILADYWVKRPGAGIRNLIPILQLRDVRRYKNIVILFPKIIEKLNKNQEYFIMEGAIKTEDFAQYECKHYRENEPFILCYSGMLSKTAGIDLLLESLQHIPNSNFELHITGRGNKEELIAERARHDKRIVFHGHMPYEDYLDLLSKAHILLNPRDMNDLTNEYNFPSKIMEYMAMGKVIVSTKFQGYEKFIEIGHFSESKPEAFAIALEEAMSYYNEEYVRIYEENREFAKQFEWSNQVKKVMKYFNIME